MGLNMALPDLLPMHLSRTSGQTIKTFKHHIIESFQWSGPDLDVPNNPGMNLMVAVMTSASINISDTQAMQFKFNKQPVQTDILLKSGGWPVGYTGCGQLVVVAKAVPIECAEPAQTIGTPRFRSRLFLLGESTPEPLPGSSKIAFLVGADRGRVRNEGERNGSEYAIIG